MFFFLFFYHLFSLLVFFTDNPPRNTSVVVVVLESSEVYIIISLSTRNDTQVIYIDPTTGSLRYQGKLGHEVFNSEEEAFKYVTDGSRWVCKNVVYASAILGYAALGSFGMLLVATKLEATIPNLPGVDVYIQLLKNIQELTDVDIDGKHYFCETRDITSPFPSRRPLDNPDSEFVWNEFLSKSFKDIGLPQHCVILLQGFADSRSLALTGQQGGTVALVARRSRLHPGTRYLARGLNACFSTGNEAECEQLVWVSQGTGQSIPFSSYIWRRGTIPVWWGAELKITAAEAEIYVSSQDPYRGSAEYYKRLSKRYGVRNSDLMIVNQKKNSLVPIVCINLLRHGEGKPETILVEHFAECLNNIKSSGKLSFTQLYLKNFDWHTNVKLKGEQETIEDLWKYLKTPNVGIGFCEGMYSPSLQQLATFKGGGFCLTGLQNGVIRFNCADSLDRTNAASYFGCLQVFAEQCRRLGISIDSDAMSTVSSTNSNSLPPGWVQYTHAETGRTYYANHNTRTTTWEHPCKEKPWKKFDMSFDQFKNSTMLYPITKLAELFLLAGDIHATLYTGSKAMHSQILNIFSDDAGKFKQFSAAQNMKITLQRRYNNVVVDSSRQKQLEMFLGIRMFKHLPSVPVYPLQVLSRPPACFLKPFLLSFKKKDMTWVCSPAADVLELFIYLEEPCHVCELLVTISHGGDDSSFPGTVDVRTGCNLDALDLVVKGAHLPRCSNGTNIILPLAGPMNGTDLALTRSGSSYHDRGNSYLPLLYNFQEPEGNLSFLTRIVVLTFHPLTTGRAPVALGEFEVLGVSLPWRRIFSKKEAGSNFIEEVQRHQKEIKSFLSVSDVDQFKNPFLGPDISHSSSASLCGGSVALRDQSKNLDLGFDLLTGESVSSQPTLQPDLPVVQDSLSFDDDWTDLLAIPSSVATLKGSDVRHESQSPKCNSGIHYYLNCFRDISDKKHELDYEDAMKLEIKRLGAGLSAADRDRALRSIEVNPDTIDPNRLVNDFDLLKLSKSADILAWLAHSAFEDKIVASIGLDIADHIGIDFWNLNVNGDNCIGSGCEVRCAAQAAEKLPSSKPSNQSKPSLIVCFFCGKRSCVVCCAGKGATLLAGYNSRENKRLSGSSSQSGSSHGGRSEGSYGPVPPDGFICKICCNEEIIYALYVDYVRTLTSLRRRDRADSAARGALGQLAGSETEANQSSGEYDRSNKWLRTLLNQKESLAEFPYASFLHSPVLSLLSPLYFGALHSYWRAPRGCSSVEFSIVLGTLSDVSGVILLVSSCGYSAFDLPLVNIWAGDKINREERSFIGKWNLQSLSAASELHGPEHPGRDRDTPRHVKFQFRNPVRCRIIWVTLTLQKAGTSSVNLEREYNLLSLDDPFSQPPAGGSFSEAAVGSDPRIHAKRLIVFGSRLVKEPRVDSSQGLDNMNANSWSERSQSWVPVETERLTGNDLILEQYLSPATPPLAGFRLDAFSIIKRRVAHSPSSLDMDKWDPSFKYLEDSSIYPPVLYVQVSAVKDNGSPVRVGEYRLPQARVGTAMYFDFPRAIQARVVVFKLLGDVTVPPCSLGLAMSGNRVRLYYYADPAQLGRLTALSAV
ncbi:unnamed protein product [Spirodela intermedia]|uniref:Uncharacterized protein n=1 Tax=Spirodela intermedia TaxID=51605 RepID=A0A7I8J3Z8_SPIIN|nr:unnamed protein product [Spirodela intermedia]CAA6664754.1 unnamed protein product [Spirodela intermedia]